MLDGHMKPEYDFSKGVRGLHMKKTKRTIIQVLEAHDKRKGRERLKVAIKWFTIGLSIGLIILGLVVLKIF